MIGLESDELFQKNRNRLQLLKFLRGKCLCSKIFTLNCVVLFGSPNIDLSVLPFCEKMHNMANSKKPKTFLRTCVSFECMNIISA